MIRNVLRGESRFSKGERTGELNGRRAGMFGWWRFGVWRGISGFPAGAVWIGLSHEAARGYALPTRIGLPGLLIESLLLAAFHRALL